MKELRGHTVVQNALWLYAVQFSGYLLPLVTLPYLSRVLTVEHFGLIAFAQSITWNFVTLTEYGFNLTATRDVAARRDDPEGISQTFNAVMAAKTMLAAVGFGILVVVLTTVPRLRPHWVLFTVCYLSVVGYLLFPVWLFQGMQKMKHIAIRDFIAKAISVVILFAIVRTDGDYVLAAAAQSGGLFLAGIIGLASVPFTFRVRFFWPGWRAVWNALLTGWPAFLSNAAGALMLSTNMSILGAKAGTAEIGYVNAAYRIVSVPRAIVGPISTAVFSHVSHSAARSEAAAIRFVRRYGWWLSLPFLLMTIMLVVLAAPIVTIVLGAKYAPARLPLQILALSPFLLAFSNVYSTYYMLACGHDKAWLRIMLVSILVDLAVLGPMVFLARGSVALAIAAISAEVFSTLAYRRFFLKQSARLEAVAAHT